MSDRRYIETTTLPPEQHDLLHELIRSDAGRSLLEAMAACRSALSAEKKANDPAARAVAQREAIGAGSKIMELLKITDLRKRRDAATAGGMSEGETISAAVFEAKLKRADRSSEGAIWLRMARARHELDDISFWGSHAAHVLAAQELQHAKGFKGPLDMPEAQTPAELQKVEEALSIGRVKRSGVTADDGALHTLKLVTAQIVGQRAGESYGAEPHEIDAEFWGRECRAFNKACEKAGISPTKHGGDMAVNTFRMMLVNRSKDSNAEYSRVFSHNRAEAVR